MQTTKNYGFKKPESNDPYNIEDFNESFELIDAELKAAADKADAVPVHVSNTGNPHRTTAAQVGLGNVPNVSTNDQTPTYVVASANAVLSSGEKLSAAMGKIAKAVSSLISHLADTVGHITAAERSSWNGKLDATATAANAHQLSGFLPLSFRGQNTGFGYTSVNGDDANNYKTEGHCFVFNMQNTPVNNEFGFLDIDYFSGAGFAPSLTSPVIRQTFTRWETGATFVRTYNSNTNYWSPWIGSVPLTTDGRVTSWFTMGGNAIYARHLDGYEENGAPADMFLNYSHPNAEIYAYTKGKGGTILHTGVSAPVIISDTAPADTSALWIS